MGKGSQGLVWREENGVSVQVDPTAAKRSRAFKEVTRAEVAKHSTEQDLWIIIEDKVYDLSKWGKLHPGGLKPLLMVAGRDATDAFEQYHPAHVWTKTLPAFQVAQLAPGDHEEPSPFVRDMRALRQELLAKGMFETRMSYYAIKAVLLTALFCAGMALTLRTSSVALHLLGALVLGVFWHQLSFIGHDIGHSAITHVHVYDYAVGVFLANFLGGVSIGWWKRTHNVHHVVCNSIESDPDIQHLPVLAVTPDIIKKPYFSTYHLKWFFLDPISKLILSWQHFLYYPVMAVARFNLCAQSFILLLAPWCDVRWPKWELAGLLGFWVWMVWVMSHLSGPVEQLAWLVLGFSVNGLLHVQITLSHFAMETYHGVTYKDTDKDGWYALQLRTTMDVDCPEWLDWLHGGLQFQLEHHFFPRLPRHNLRYAHNRVKEICRTHNMPMVCLPFYDANVMVIDNFRKCAMVARNTPWGQTRWSASMLAEGLNAQG